MQPNPRYHRCVPTSDQNLKDQLQHFLNHCAHGCHQANTASNKVTNQVSATGKTQLAYLLALGQT